MLRSIYLICFVFFINTYLFANNGYKIGDIATDFSLRNVDNNMVSLSDYKNVKGYIIIFTCNTCPYAV